MKDNNMNKIATHLPCPLCKAMHLVPISRNRSKCKSCKTWLQINRAGDALQDFYIAKNTNYLQKKSKPRIVQLKCDNSNIQW
jgi:transposase-like protein